MILTIANIPTPEKILELLKLHYTLTRNYISYIKNSGLTEENKRKAIAPLGDWKVHDLTKEYPIIAEYFSPIISQKSGMLLTKWTNFVNFQAKQSYLADPEGREREKINPWDDTKDLSGNLYEKPTLEKMPIYEIMSQPESLYNRVHFEHVFRIATHPTTLEIYKQKKSLEERMIEHLAPQIGEKEECFILAL